MDLVITGGNVLTLDGTGARAQAIAISDGKVKAVGASAEIDAMAGPDTRVEHLTGRTLMPGFIDPHTHFSVTTLEPVSVDCSVPPHENVNSILDAIAVAAAAAPRGKWIRGWGMSSSRLKGGMRLLRSDLDEVAPDNPVCIMDSSCHACYANSAALRLAGIDRHTPDPPHGQILHGEDGEPNGTLWEGAMDPVYNLSLRAHLDHYGDSIADLVEHNARRHASLGITSVGDACVVPDAAELYRRANAARKLPITLHQLIAGDGFFAAPDATSRGERVLEVSDRLRAGTMKIFMDPVFPSAARLKFSPEGHVEHTGVRYYTQEEADELVLNAHRRGMQVAIHALGAWAVEQALNSFERALREHPVEEPRFRIEHGGSLTLEQVKREASLGVIASLQPSFIYGMNESYLARIQEDGDQILAYPLRTMLSEGVVVAASSDNPCADLNPLLGLYSIVTRKTRYLSQPVVAEEAVTAEEGLRMYTLGAAYAMNREHEVGSLEVGKRADMAVLSHDPTAVSPDAIKDLVVERTYVDGQTVYQR